MTGAVLGFYARGQVVDVGLMVIARKPDFFDAVEVTSAIKGGRERESGFAL